ncbi:hypothetical protein D3C85_1332810 [compost metagenome]
MQQRRAPFQRGHGAMPDLRGRDQFGQRRTAGQAVHGSEYAFAIQLCAIRDGAHLRQLFRPCRGGQGRQRLRAHAVRTVPLHCRDRIAAVHDDSNPGRPAGASKP